MKFYEASHYDHDDRETEPLPEHHADYDTCRDDSKTEPEYDYLHRPPFDTTCAGYFEITKRSEETGVVLWYSKAHYFKTPEEARHMTKKIVAMLNG